MFQIEPITPPEEVAHVGGIAILTHKATVLVADPRSILPSSLLHGQPAALVVTEMKGWMDGDRFQDFGPHTHHALDAQGLQEMLADTSGGKPAGVFRTTDILPAVQRREAAREAAKEAEAREAEREASREARRVREPAPEEA